MRRPPTTPNGLVRPFGESRRDAGEKGLRPGDTTFPRVASAPGPGCGGKGRHGRSAGIETHSAHGGPAQFLRRRPAGLDGGRVRLLHRGPRLRGHRQGVPRLADDDGLPDDGDADHAARRRDHLRTLGGPPGAAHPAAGRRQLLLRRRFPVRLLAELHRAAGPAPAVRHRNGRRAGARRGPGHGEDPREPARLLLGRAPARLLAGLPAGLARRALVVGPGPALALRAVGAPGPAQPADPHPGQGVRGLGGDAGADAGHAVVAARRVPQSGGAAPLRLPDPADDRLQLDEPRHAGPLPDVPEGPRQRRRRAVGDHRHVDRRALHRRGHDPVASSSGRSPSVSAAGTRLSSARSSASRSPRSSRCRRLRAGSRSVPSSCRSRCRAPGA